MPATSNVWATWTPARAPLAPGRMPSPIGPSHRHPTPCTSPASASARTSSTTRGHPPHRRDHRATAGRPSGGDRPRPRAPSPAGCCGGRPARRGRARPRPDRAPARALRGIGELRIHSADALRFDLCALAAGRERLRLVGNLPYNISTPLLFHFLDQTDCILDMHLMLQKEVVERIAADPGGRDYGRLSVMAAGRCAVDALFTHRPGRLHPGPQGRVRLPAPAPTRGPAAPDGRPATARPAGGRGLLPAPQDAAQQPARGCSPPGCFAGPGSTPGRGPSSSGRRHSSGSPTRLANPRHAQKLTSREWGLAARRAAAGRRLPNRVIAGRNRPMTDGTAESEAVVEIEAQGRAAARAGAGQRRAAPRRSTCCPWPPAPSSRARRSR